jgi:hypothetical protein
MYALEDFLKSAISSLCEYFDPERPRLILSGPVSFKAATKDVHRAYPALCPWNGSDL